VVSLCAAAIAIAAASAISTPIAQWACFLVRDLSLATSSFILLALGVRHVRASGISSRTLSYPIGGILMFAFLIGGSIWAHSVLQSPVNLLGMDAPAELSAQSETVRRAVFVWCGLAVVAGLVGLFTPLRAPAA